MAHPSILFIDSGPHFLPYSLFAPSSPLFSLMLSPYISNPYIVDLCPILLLNTSSSSLGIITLCLITSILSQFSLHCLHLLSLSLSLSHSYKFTPSATPISNHHSHLLLIRVQLLLLCPTIPPIQSHSASNSSLFVYIGPNFPHLTHFGPCE